MSPHFYFTIHDYLCSFHSYSKIVKIPLYPAHAAASYIVQKLQVASAHVVLLLSLPEALIWLPKEKGGTERIMVSTPQNFVLQPAHDFLDKVDIPNSFSSFNL